MSTKTLAMPHFYFSIRDRLGHTPDDIGVELDSPAQAYDYAIASIRSIVADDARRGVLSLGGYIDINDDMGHLVRVWYSHAFDAVTHDCPAPSTEADNDNSVKDARLHEQSGRG